MPNKIQLNSHCKQLFMEQSLKRMRKEHKLDNEWDFFKVSLISKNFLLTSRHYPIYSMGVINNRDGFQYGVVEIDDDHLFKTNCSKTKDLKEMRNLFLLFQPKLFSIKLDYKKYTQECLKQFVGTFDDLDCSFSVQIDCGDIDYSILLNRLNPRLKKLKCSIEVLLKESIEPLTLGMFKIECYWSDKCIHALNKHKIKTLEYRAYSLFESDPERNEVIEKTENVDYLESIFFADYTYLQNLVKYLVKHEIRLKSLSSEFEKQCKNESKFHNVLEGLHNLYTQIEESKEVLRKPGHYLHINIDAEITISEYIWDDKGDLIKKVLSGDLFPTAKHIAKNEQHTFVVCSGCLIFNFIVKLDKECMSSDSD